MKATHRRFSMACIRAAIVVLTACSIATAQGVTFLGVAAGDATSSSVTLWARAQQPGLQTGVGIMGLISPDPAFSSDVMHTAGVPDPAHDFTIHFSVTRLKSGTRYYYRFLAKDSTLSQVGTFVTAPDPAARVPVRLGFTGDADGLMRPYDATNSVHFLPPGAPGFGPQSFDYFIWLGDTIYETASGQGTPDSSPAVSTTPALADYWRKYREQFIPVSTGSYASLKNYFAAAGHYTLLDNHELGNREFINGGASATAPFNTTDVSFDVNTSGTYRHNTPGFKILEQAYSDYQPIRVATVNAPGDPRSDGTQKFYFSQQWGANSIFFNLDDRTYRDIRLRNASGDDNGPRADNPNRTMLGSTQMQWFEQALLDAQWQGITWKIVAVSSPIDQIGPIGGSFTVTNGVDNGPGTYSTPESDGGKSWMGGYRPERNQLFKFIADNHIDHVVFLSTDDHQLRINELGYFTQFDSNNTPIQSSYVRTPGAFEIVAGPIGATGPDGITDHTIPNLLQIARNFAAQQAGRGIDPIGLDPSFPGLHAVFREGDAAADMVRQPFDFFSPDTFNYATLEIGACPTLTVSIYGIDSYAVNTFPQPPTPSPVRQILSFKIDPDPRNPCLESASVQ